MAKPIDQKNFLTSDGSRIYPAPFFLYEVTTYKLFREGRAELVNSKFFRASKPLAMLGYKAVKNKDYLLEMTVTWTGAPMQYIIDNNLPIYDPKKKKNEKRRNNVRERSHSRLCR